MFSRAERVERAEAFWTGFTGSTGFELCGAKAGQTTAQVADDGIHEKERLADVADVVEALDSDGDRHGDSFSYSQSAGVPFAFHPKLLAPSAQKEHANDGHMR